MSIQHNYQKKLMETWALAAGITVTAILFVGLAFGPALALYRGIVANITDTSTVALLLATANLTITSTFGFFVLARWLTIRDEMEAMKGKAASAEAKYSTVAGIMTQLSDEVRQLSDHVSQLLQAQGSRVLKDEAAVWGGFSAGILNVFNTTMTNEVTFAGSRDGRFRIIINAERAEIFYRRFTVPRIQINYLFFVPGSLAFGNHPIEALLKLICMYRQVRKMAAERGTVATTPRIFLRDAPRPTSTYLVGTRRVGNQRCRVALEYFRNTAPGSSGTPTGDRQLIEHDDAGQVEFLDRYFEQNVAQSAEIAFDIAESIIAPLLPSGDEAVCVLTLGQLQHVTEQLYQHTIRRNLEFVAYSDHFAIHETEPSIYAPPAPPAPRTDVVEDERRRAI